MPTARRASHLWLAAIATWSLVFASSFTQPSITLADAPDEDLVRVRSVEASRIAAIEKVYHTVVAIYPPNRQGGGSGVVYDPAGYVLTNYHVTAGAGLIGVAGLADGKLYKWHLVGHDPGGDLAIIKLEGPTPDHKFHFARLADSDNVRVGDFAMAMGNPFILAEDQTPTVTLGIVSGVKRYQPGTGPGGKMLEYGNCIQIDSSINPGNSGGPLFNMMGEVIGINGRGSFEERGRVNVGVGYAISANQCKTFIPELLATKTCEHGTLDAVFNRRGNNEVVCESINLDSPLAKAGFDLGDRLVKFDGQEIRSTHEFTNLIATLPANWPVEVVWDNDGKTKSAWVRLTAITYPKPPAPPARPQPAPKAEEKKKDEKKDAPKEEQKPEEKKADGAAPQAGQEKTSPFEPVKKPAKEEPKSDSKETPKPAQPQPVPVPLKGLPAQASMEFGKARDMKMNEREAIRIIGQYVAYLGGREQVDQVKGFRATSQAKQDGKVVGESTSITAIDGRNKATMTDTKEGGSTVTTSIWDGQRFWQDAAGQITNLEGDQAKRNPAVALNMLFANMLSPKLKDHFKRIVLQGADKAQGQRAYRILFEDNAGNRMIAWFSVLNAAGDFETRLMKVAFADDKDQPRDPAVTVEDYRSVESTRYPHRQRLVMGLEETTIVDMTLTKVELLRELDQDAFVIPDKK